MRPIEKTKIAEIIEAIKSGQSSRKIAHYSGISLGAISKIRNSHLKEHPKSVGGCPRKLSPRDISHGVRLITTAKATTAVDVKKSFEEMNNITVSAETVRRDLKKHGMKAVVQAKKPKLTQRHKKLRMEFATKYKDWTVEDWKRVIWSDETKINRCGSDGKKWVWKKQGEGLSDRLVQGTVMKCL